MQEPALIGGQFRARDTEYTCRNLFGSDVSGGDGPHGAYFTMQSWPDALSAEQKDLALSALRPVKAVR